MINHYDIKKNNQYKIFYLYLKKYPFYKYKINIFYKTIEENNTKENLILFNKIFTCIGFQYYEIKHVYYLDFVIVMGDMHIANNQINFPHTQEILKNNRLKKYVWEELKSLKKMILYY